MGVVMSDDGWRMSDWLWERVDQLLPARPADPLGCHNPCVPGRDATDAILLVFPHRDAVERAVRDRDLFVELGAPTLSGVGAGGGVTRRSGGRGCSIATSESGSIGPGCPVMGRPGRRRWVARRPVRIPLTGQKGGETFASLRGGRGPDRAGTRRRQPPRFKAPSPDARLGSDPSARAVRRAVARPRPGRRLRLPMGRRARGRPRLHTAHPSTQRRARANEPRRDGAPDAGSSKPATPGSTATAPTAG
jgi:hypothetical protein